MKNLHTLLLSLSLISAASAQVWVTVPGTSDIYLAGMPDGSTASIDDTAPGQSPAQVMGLTFTAGDHLTFAPTGATSNGPSFTLTGPEGDSTWIISHSPGAENGLSDISAPIDSLIGVFLTDDQPSLSLAPGGLDFTDPSARDFATLSPEIGQVFFIGDGLDSLNNVQDFIAPTGATRLFLGTMDGFEWNNNPGSLSVLVSDLSPSAVPEPSTYGFIGAGLLLGAVALRRRN